MLDKAETPDAAKKRRVRSAEYFRKWRAQKAAKEGLAAVVAEPTSSDATMVTLEPATAQPELQPVVSERGDRVDILYLGIDGKTGLPTEAFRPRDAPKDTPKLVARCLITSGPNRLRSSSHKGLTSRARPSVSQSEPRVFGKLCPSLSGRIFGSARLSSIRNSLPSRAADCTRSRRRKPV